MIKILNALSFGCLVGLLSIVLFFKDSYSPHEYFLFQIVLGIGLVIWAIELVIFLLKLRKTQQGR